MNTETGKNQETVHQTFAGSIYEDVRLGARPENWNQPLLGSSLALAYFQSTSNRLAATTRQAMNAYMASPRDQGLKKAYRDARTNEQAYHAAHAADIEWEVAAGFRDLGDMGNQKDPGQV